MSGGDNMKSIMVQMPQSLIDRLNAEADRTAQSRASVIRRMLIESMDAEKKWPMMTHEDRGSYNAHSEKTDAI